MPVAKASIERNNFTRGLITEATALTFPENAAVDIDNMVINRDGSIKRRLGIDTENNSTTLDTGKAPTVFDYNAVTTYSWTNVNNDPNTSISVVQVGNQLWFFDAFASVLSTNFKNVDVSGNNAAVTLLDTATDEGSSISGNKPLSYTSVAGVLILSGEELSNPIYVEYIEDTNQVQMADINIKVRDLWGVYDGLLVNDRPGILSQEHEYNLLNQGWLPSRITLDYKREIVATTGTLKAAFPTAYNSAGFAVYFGVPRPGGGRGSSNRTARRNWEEAQKVYEEYGTDGNLVKEDLTIAHGYPANSDIPWIGKNIDPSSGNPTFKPAFYDEQSEGSTSAPKGRFIIDAFNRGGDRAQQSGTTTGGDNEQGNISVVAAFANRVFYSGVDSYVDEPNRHSPDYTGTLFFTRNVESFEDFSKCYQDADPTAEEDPTLVATDGGVIKIAEAGRIRKLIAMQASLLIFAENGVWELSGPEGVFRADDFSIRQVSNIGCYNATSVIVAQDSVMYWADSGIYLISSDQISGKFNAQSVSATTIQSFYDDIPNVGKEHATGVFDAVSGKIRWLYSDDPSYSGNTLRHKYNRELVFDIVLGSFYTNTINYGTNGDFAAGYIKTEDFVVVTSQQDVVVDGEPVTVNGEQVVVSVPYRGRSVSRIKYLAFRPNHSGTNYGMKFCLYTNTNFQDWGETDSGAFLVAGYELGGDTQRKKQVVYLTTHFNQTETGFNADGDELVVVGGSSCYVTPYWDFADSTASGKVGNQFQAYRLKRNYIPLDVTDTFDYGYSIINTKTKVRGSGKALSLRFDSEPLKDLQLLGWGLSLTGVQSV